MSQLNVAIAGASGFVGEHLIKDLVEKSFLVHALSRSKKKESSNNVKWMCCDLFSLTDTAQALKGCDVAIYLAHSMLPNAKLAQGNFSDYDLVLADNFARAAKRHHIKQIIYLGGIIPDGCLLSEHLLSRLEVERALRASGVPVTSLRTGIILGPEGSSFRVMYHLVNRLPVMVCPSWTSTLSNPISIMDVIKTINYCINNPTTFGDVFDIGGQTTLSYLEMMKILGEKVNKKRLLLSVPFFSPELSKLWVSTVTGAPKNLVYPLISSLKTHMVPNVNQSIPGFNLKPESYVQSLDRILKNKSALKKIPHAFRVGKQKTDNMVRSIQRLETLYRFSAEEVASQYFTWLDQSIPFIYVKQENELISIFFKGVNKALLSFEFSKEKSSKNFQVFFIRKGLLTEGKGRGRLVFRTIIDNRFTMIEVHEFKPLLPWYLYKYTQANLHLLIVRWFNSYLLGLRKNVVKNKLR